MTRQRPTNTKLIFNFPTLNRFLLLSPEPLPTFSAWTINSPSMFWACVQQTDGEGSAEGKRQRERQNVPCSQLRRSWQLWPEACMAALCEAGSAEEGRNAVYPEPPQTTIWMAWLHGVSTQDQTGWKSCRGSTTLNNTVKALGNENNGVMQRLTQPGASSVDQGRCTYCQDRETNSRF